VTFTESNTETQTPLPPTRQAPGAIPFDNRPGEVAVHNMNAIAATADEPAWTEWFIAKLLNNGGAKEALRPTLGGTSHPELRQIARDEEIEWEMDFVGIVQTGFARCNGVGNFFLRGCRLDISWPGLPDRAHYLVRFRPKPVEAASVRAEADTSDGGGAVPQSRHE
jgi:hypothetical protein